MIYVTEQQVIVTAGIVVIVAVVALLMGMWWGQARGYERAEEEQHWEREQARARRTHPVYRQPPEVTHDQTWPAPPEPVTETLIPSAVLSPAEVSVTGWTNKMAADMDAFLADLIGGTDEQLREITR